MNAEAIISVSAAVVTLTQFSKWGGVQDKYGPLMVMVLSALGVFFWGWSHDAVFERIDAFSYFVGWITVTTSAAGVFGFTRAASENITRVTAPPTGAAGASPTVKNA